MRVLSLSTVYPNPAEPCLGTFVRSRLQGLAARAQVKVIAPVPAFHYAHWTSQPWKWRHIPESNPDGPMDVFHPTWWHPPFGGCMNPIFLFGRLVPILALLRQRFSFQIIDGHFGYPEGIAASLLARAFRVPFTITLRGNETMHASHWARRAAMARSLRRASRVFTVSERLRQFAISMGVAPANVKAIPNGVDPNVFFPRDRVECKRRYAIDKAPLTVLSAGSLIERKGHHRIVSALAELASQGIVANLVIAGGPGREGNFESLLRRSAAASSIAHRIRFLGEVSPESMPELMSAADVLCLASSREGWPNVVHEALACGTPVVATDVGGVPDLIPSPDYGVVAPAQDHGALMRCLNVALSRDWDRCAIARWAHSRSWIQVGREVADELQEAIEEHYTKGTRV